MLNLKDSMHYKYSFIHAAFSSAISTSTFGSDSFTLKALKMVSLWENVHSEFTDDLHACRYSV